MSLCWVSHKKRADLNQLVQEGQLYWAFALSKTSLVKISRYCLDSKVSQVRSDALPRPNSYSQFFGYCTVFVSYCLYRVSSSITYECIMIKLSSINTSNTYTVMYQTPIRKDCFQNKSKFITKDHFVEHVNITNH